MSETLQEFIDSRGLALRVDRETGVIRGVKLLGLRSRNGRSYPTATLAAAATLYEGAKVNVNHPKGGPLAPRNYEERLGAIHNVGLREGEGLFGDLHFNPKHALAEQLAWDAVHAPRNVGFSHNVVALVARVGDREVVEAIQRVHSVDLVADPATTHGLFEHAAGASSADHGGEIPAELAELSLDALRRHRPDLVAELLEHERLEQQRLRAEVERYRLLESFDRKRATARRLLREHDLPDPDADDAQPLVSEAFVESLVAATDESQMRRLVEERARLVQAAARWPGEPRRARRPVSRDQHALESLAAAPSDAAAFVRAIT